MDDFIYGLETYSIQTPDAENSEPGNVWNGVDRRLILCHFDNMIRDIFKRMIYGSEWLERIKPDPNELKRLEDYARIIPLGDLIQIEPIRGFEHLHRYRYQNPNFTTYANSTGDSYLGFVLLVNYGYPNPRDFTFLILAPNQARPIIWHAKNDLRALIGQSILSAWLSGRLFGHNSRRELYHNQLRYLEKFSHWIRLNPFADFWKLKRNNVTYGDIAQWENLLELDDLTTTQTELRPDVESTFDHARWLIFADSLEEKNPNHPALPLIRFFHTKKD